LDALVGDFRLVGNAEESHHHADRVEPQRLLDRSLDHAAEKRAWQVLAVDIGHVGAQDEGGFMAPRITLENRRLSDGQLNRVRRRFDQRGDGLPDVFDAGKKSVFVEKAMIDGHVEAAVRFGIKEAVEAGGFHRLEEEGIACD
jgi:hypothetical protein